MSEGQVIDGWWIERNGKLDAATACLWMASGWPWFDGLFKERVVFVQIIKPIEIRGIFHLVEFEPLEQSTAT
jgi:hypothetical protein